MKKVFFGIALVACSILLVRAEAGSVPTVWINEVAWMGTLANANAEWIELQNQSEAVIDLTGWTLRAADGTPSIALNGTIGAHSFFLLERTSDATLPDVAADQIYTGALGNTGEVLILKNAAGVEIDRVDGSSSWALGGNSTTGQTLERKQDGGFQTSASPGGTPRALNSGIVLDQTAPTISIAPPGGNYAIAQSITLTADEAATIYYTLDDTDPDQSSAVYVAPVSICSSTVLKFFGVDAAGNASIIQTAEYTFPPPPPPPDPIVDPEPEPDPSPPDPVIDPEPEPEPPIEPEPSASGAHLLISEFIPNPIGLDSENEWIEILNSGDAVLDLTGFKINSMQLLSATIEPGTYKYLVAGDPNNSAAVANRLSYSGSWSALTNTGGEVILKNAQNETLDSRSYENSTEGKSFGRKVDNLGTWQEFAHPTPGAANLESNASPLPVITIQGTGQSSGTCSLYVNLTAENSSDPDGDALTFRWDFGNGVTSTEENPAGFYFSPGNSVVTLAVTDSAGATASVSQSFSVAACSTGGGGGSTSSTNNTTTSVTMTNSNAAASYEKVKILITAVAFNSDPDWAKLYIVDDGATGAGVDLGGFALEDDSKFKTITAGTLLKTGEEILLHFDSTDVDEKAAIAGVLQLYAEKSGLTKTDEQFILRDPNGAIKDAVVWENRSGAWSSGEDKDTAELVTAGAWDSTETTAAVDSSLVEREATIVRKQDEKTKIYLDTNSQEDWVIEAAESEAPPVAVQEKIVAETPITETLSSVEMSQCSAGADCNAVRISEILPNPIGDDAAGEWIELQNFGATALDLAGWKIVAGKSHYEFPPGTEISAGEFLLLPRSKSKVTLKNSDGELSLLSSGGDVVSKISYAASKENVALAWDGEKYVATAVLTPGAANSIFVPAVKVKKVAAQKLAPRNGDLSDQVVVSEVLANPAGKDNGMEWIELVNLGSQNVNLGSWRLDDAEDGSKPFVIPDTVQLRPGEYRVFPGKLTKLALNNSGSEFVRLFDYQGKLISSLSVSDSREGVALARDSDGEYRETVLLTPGQPNQFATAKVSGTVKSWDQKALVLVTAVGEQPVKFSGSTKSFLAQALLREGASWKVFTSPGDSEPLLDDFAIQPEIVTTQLPTNIVVSSNKAVSPVWSLALVLCGALYLGLRFLLPIREVLIFAFAEERNM